MNTWTHLASTFDGSTVRLFVNGVQVGEPGADRSLCRRPRPRCRSAPTLYTTEYFAGLIDEVRIYNRALSAAEIQSDMATSVSSVTPPPPVAIPPRRARPAR